VVAHVGKSGSSPQGKRLVPQGKGGAWLALHLARLADELFEALGVAVASQPVAGRRRLDRRPQALAQSPDLGLQGTAGVGGLVVTPQRLHQLLGADDLAGGGEQHREEQALTGAGQREHDTSVVENLERPEHPVPRLPGESVSARHRPPEASP
jgi:hypothetical protein